MEDNPCSKLFPHCHIQTLSLKSRMSSFTASSVERGVVSSENNLFEIAAAL